MIRSALRLTCAATLSVALVGTAGLPALAATSTRGRTTHPAVVAVRRAPVANLSRFEAALLNDINAARHRAGVAPLVAAPGTTDVARRWSARLAATSALAHNPSLVRGLQSAGSARWTFIAENVGTGPAGDEKALFGAYMASQHHRENILSPRAKFIGIGTVQGTDADGDAVAWNTCDFTDAYSAGYGPNRTTVLSAAAAVQRASAVH